MKMAWIATSGPKDNNEKQLKAASGRLEVIADTYLSMSAPIQLATPVLVEQRKLIQPQILNRVRQNLTELDRQLANQKNRRRLNV